MTRKNEAVSELVGTMLLLGIAVASFSILYVYTTTHEWIHIDKPTPNVFGTANYTGVLLEHGSGVEVSDYMVLVNGVKVAIGKNWTIGNTIYVPAKTHDSLLMIGDDQLVMQWPDIVLPIAPAPYIPQTSEWLNVDSWSKTYNSSYWHKVGIKPYLNSKDYPTNYIYATNSEAQKIGIFGFQNTTLSGSSFAVNISFYCWDSDVTGLFNAYINYTASGTSWSILAHTFGKHTTPSYETVSLGTFSLSKLNNVRIYLTGYSSAGKYLYVDHVKLGVKIV